jgi:hypothetical protein
VYVEIITVSPMLVYFVYVKATRRWSFIGGSFLAVHLLDYLYSLDGYAFRTIALPVTVECSLAIDFVNYLLIS